MSSHRTPGQEPHSHDEVRDLLAQAVADIEPGDHLAAIRNRTKESTMSSRRPWIYGVTGAAVATAATITAVAVLGNPSGNEADPRPAQSPSTGATASPSPSETAAESPSSSPDAKGTTSAVPVYFVGDVSRGPRLFREFHKVDVTSPADKVSGALTGAVAGQPLDPDYRTPWPEGARVEAVQDADISGEVITVRLTGASADRPQGLSAEEAELAVQQLVFTAQAAVGTGRHPVQFLLDGTSTPTLLGVPTADPVANAAVLDTLSLMNITAPREGVTVQGKFTATGVNNGFEAWVGWQLVDADGSVVKEGFGTAEGWAEEKLFAWEVEVDTSGLAPGDYTFRAHNDDPSAGEGSGPDEDTRTVTVK